MSAVKTIGYIGLGHAGYPLAGLLPKAGYQVTVQDADPARAKKFASEHSSAKAADGPSAFKDVDLLITMLPNGAIVKEVLLGADGTNGIAHNLKDGAVIVDTSSSSPFHTRELGDALKTLNPTLTLVDSPVTQEYAHALEKGDATLMVGCSDQEALEKAMPVLKILAKHVFVMGGLGAGHAMKTLNNYTSIGSILALSDALVAGQKFGLDPKVMLDVMNVGTGVNFSTKEAFRTDGLTRVYDSGYQLSLLVKDAKIARDVIASMGVPTDLSDLAVKELSDALEVADEGACHTQVLKQYERKAGIQLKKTEGNP